MSVQMWTDGSTRGYQGPGGWSNIIVFSGRDTRILGGFLPHATTNRMEVMAVLGGLMYINSGSRKIDVITDSDYVRLGVSQVRVGKLPGTNVDLWARIMEIIAEKGHRLVAHRVYGHRPAQADLVHIFAQHCMTNQTTLTESYPNIDAALRRHGRTPRKAW